MALKTWECRSRSREITHECENGIYRQIVSPQRLREVLDSDGDDYSKPSWMTDKDEWNV